MKRILLLLIVGALPCSLLADTMYVTDQLRLGVHAAQDTSDKAFAYLGSGDRVETLERRGSYVKVRMEDGREGWVRGAFLLSTEPAARKLKTLMAERDALEKELAGIRGSGQAKRIETLERRLRELRGQLAERDVKLTELQKKVAEQSRRLAGLRTAIPLSWTLLAVVVALLAGVLSGWWWFDRASRRRHGGYRVY